MTRREKFEAFIFRNTRAEIFKSRPDFPEGALETIVREIALVRDGEGYKPQRTQEWWVVWNECCDSMVVDIGEGIPAGEFRESAKVISISEAIIRIEAAGVQVKS